MKIGRYSVKISNQDKVLFPESGITKGDLIKYYDEMADYILPYLKDRPLTLQRFPDGIDTNGFFQKDKSDYFPNWIDSVEVLRADQSKIDMVVVNKKAALIYLINQGTIIPHIWLSRSDKPDYPDRLIFDLDPPDHNFKLVVNGAKKLKELADEIGLNAYLMTSGSAGVHVVIPIIRQYPFDETRAFAQNMTHYLASKHPEDFTIEVRKEKRKGRLFLDYLRNAYAQTGVTPYGVRALEKAPVATPLQWNELNDRNLHAQQFNIRNMKNRINQKGDVWHNIKNHAKSLKKPTTQLEKKLEKMEEEYA